MTKPDFSEQGPKSWFAIFRAAGGDISLVLFVFALLFFLFDDELSTFETVFAFCYLLSPVWFLAKTWKVIRVRNLGETKTAVVEQIVENLSSGTPTGNGYLIFRTEDGRRAESLNHEIQKLHKVGVGTKIEVFVHGDDAKWIEDVGSKRASYL
ncbi:hypothetical protein SAMN05444003_0026 [Cognatiyoonia sediminum]|uniref:Uncharacterized protein n=1 Tax=Cognatiyoonia sediminum TaxID=1508389 RepID=A0A1M5L210_9RHOB|nr:hypothetical protein [Cognatiyoonia sediminum]SHG58463.1 hypothetical protein SAMN05444003_0026 [Cognatiyoonia sediminum]